MYQVFKFEIYRAFHGKLFRISVFVGLALILCDILMFSIRYGVPSDRVLLSAWFGSDFQFVWNQIYYLIFPILAALPYGGSYYMDCIRGYNGEICLKTSRYNYLLSKMCAIFISSFSSITIPLMLSLFIVGGLYPDIKPSILNPSTLYVLDTGLFSSLFHVDPVLFCLAYILADGMFAGVIGLIALAVTGLCRSHFMTVTVPWLLCMIFSTVFELNDTFFGWSLMYMINPINSDVHLYQMFTVFFLLLICSISCIFIAYGKKDII